MRTLRAVALVAVATAMFASPAAAQSYFGQNQVQYDKFDWKVLETEHFLVHYYEAEKDAAHDAARMAERAYGRLSRVLGHQFREKKPIILYSSRSDFGQNNVTGDLGEFTGGVTEGLRHRILRYRQLRGIEVDLEAFGVEHTPVKRLVLNFLSAEGLRRTRRRVH